MQLAPSNGGGATLNNKLMTSTDKANFSTGHAFISFFSLRIYLNRYGF